MRISASTTLNLFASWFVLCVTSNLCSVNAAVNRNGIIGTRSLWSNKNNKVRCTLCKTSSNNLSFIRTATSRTLFNTRGGSDSSDSEEESSSEEDFSEEEEDDEELFGDFDLDGDDGDDFKEDNMMDRLIEEYHRTPPITKAYLTASFVATALGYLFSGNQFPPLLSLDWNKVFKNGQIWRPFTAFLNLGSFGLIGYPMTIHFVHQYMSYLERLAHNKPYDFWVMIVFGMASMQIGYPIMKLSPRFLGHNFSTFLSYIWSRMFEGVDVAVFEVITIKAETLPWFMLAQVRHVTSY